MSAMNVKTVAEKFLDKEDLIKRPFYVKLDVLLH